MNENNYYYKKELTVDALNPVKKRPGMYIGWMNNRGVFSMIVSLFDELSIDSKSKVYLAIDKNRLHFKFENIELNLTESPSEKKSITGQIEKELCDV